jgi:hypothetical protein
VRGTAAVTNPAVRVVGVEMHGEGACPSGGLQLAVAAVVATAVGRIRKQALGGADKRRDDGATQKGAENLI